MTETIPEMIELAREAAASIRPYSHNSALILDGERDGTDVVQAALAAIIKTTEQLADWHERTGCQYSSPTLKHKIRNGDFLK